MLNLGSDEQDTGDLTHALIHLQQAEAGLVAVSGARSPTVQAARVAIASVLSDLGRHADALALIGTVDPVAYQASMPDPGRAAVLQGLQARIVLGMGQRQKGMAMMRAAVSAMHAQGVSEEEIAPFRKTLRAPVVAANRQRN